MTWNKATKEVFMINLQKKRVSHQMSIFEHLSQLFHVIQGHTEISGDENFLHLDLMLQCSQAPFSSSTFPVAQSAVFNYARWEAREGAGHWRDEITY